MSRKQCIARAQGYFDNGLFMAQLARRVAIPTESPNPARDHEMRSYLEDELGSELRDLGFVCETLSNPANVRQPFMIACRHEGDHLPTILIYGHADVVTGMDGWRQGLDPWVLRQENGRIYGRGTADNKGQHTICMLAIRALLEQHGALGFNAKFLFETGEESGSAGIHEFCAIHSTALAADALIASDGPRFAPASPTVMTGTRGILNFTLKVSLRKSGHHSGVHGGLLSSASIVLINALSTVVDGRGRILVPEWRPEGVPKSVHVALRKLNFVNDPPAEPEWGEPGLLPIERMIAWNSFDVLAMKCGNPDRPANAIPPSAVAHCSLRYIPETDPESIVPSLRRHLDARGFSMVEIEAAEGGARATRMDPEDPWVRWAVDSMRESSGREPVIIPSVGGTLPNDAFAITLNLPTLWIPHSYSGCSQHAPDEHMLEDLAREGLALMTGLYWDVGHRHGPWRHASPGHQIN